MRWSLIFIVAVSLITGAAAHDVKDSALQARVDSLTSELEQAQEAVKVDTLVLTPWDYRDSLVAQQARLYGVPERLALAVSKVENWRGLPWATSPVGAYGLMQVMPLWEGTYPECGDPFDPDQPKAQACYGVRILGHYLNQHRGNEDAALRAYNGAITPWKGDRYVRLVSQRKEVL